MATETANKLSEAGGKVFDEVFQNIRKAAEANIKMQQEVFGQWTKLWTGSTPDDSEWIAKVRDFQKEVTGTISELARKHRDVLDRQYAAALESLDETLRVTESKDPQELRARSEQLCRKTLDSLREISEAQMGEFQDAISKWSELVTKKST